MSLLDSVMSVLPGQAANLLKNAEFYSELTNILTKTGHGGLAGLVQQFKDKGYGDQAASWIGGGANHPITSAAIIEVIGQDRINAIAKQTGVGPEEITAGLTYILPHLIDALTPNGKVPATPAEVTTALKK